MPETTLGALYNGEREVSWRRFSGVKNFGDRPGVTVTEAMQELGLDFDVITTPLHTTVDGAEIPVPGRTAIVRTGAKPHVYGTTGTEYQPLQNRDIARMLDPLTEKWKLDSIASQHNGRDTVLAFKTAEVEVNGEPLQEYFWGTTSHDGLRAVKFMLLPVRLFCTNQLVTGLKRASFQANIAHTAGIQNDVAFQLAIFQFMEDARRQLNISFEEMGKLHLTPEQIEDIIKGVYPEPRIPKRVEQLHLMARATAKADGTLDESFRDTMDADQLALTDTAYLNYERDVELVKVVRKDAATLLEKFNDEHTRLANTGWSLYNAIVELADYRGTVKSSESVAFSALMGPRAVEKEKAFSSVMALAQPGWSETAVLVEGLSSPSAAARQAKEIARQRAAEIREQRAAERAAERYAAGIEAGRIKPRYAEDGTLLPPLTPEEILEERIAKENDELAKLEARLNQRKQEQEARLKAQEDRLNQRKQEAAARAQARATALTERAAAINSQPIDTALSPDDEVPDIEDTPAPTGRKR